MTPAAEPPRHLDVLGDCAAVVAGAAHVHIDGAAADRLAGLLGASPAPPRWPAPHLAATEAGAEAAAAWTLTLSAMNFCFWGDEPRWRVAGHDGYLGLAHALRRAHDGGLGPADPARVAAWSVADVAAVLAGDPDGPAAPPLLAERHAVTVELAGWLCSRWAGSALAALGSAADAAAFAQTLAATLDGFADVAGWRGRRIAFLKRAQIAAHDCAAALGDTSPGGLRDRRGLTAFADYKLPQLLRHHGVLGYAPALAALIDARRELTTGCAEEVEIRAATVVAVHRVAETLRDRGEPVDDCDVDTRLWWLSQSARGMAPYHRVRTVWY